MPCQAWGGGVGGLPQGPSWQPLLPASVELAFLRGSVTPELFRCSCLKLGDKSRQTEKFLPCSGAPGLPPREPQAAPPGARGLTWMAPTSNQVDSPLHAMDLPTQPCNSLPGVPPLASKAFSGAFLVAQWPRPPPPPAPSETNAAHGGLYGARRQRVARLTLRGKFGGGRQGALMRGRQQRRRRGGGGGCGPGRKREPGSAGALRPRAFPGPPGTAPPVVVAASRPQYSSHQQPLFKRGPQDLVDAANPQNGAQHLAPLFAECLNEMPSSLAALAECVWSKPRPPPTVCPLRAKPGFPHLLVLPGADIL
ncbi:hypothetical protein R6Z07F_012696 [Ovis aries]